MLWEHGALHDFCYAHRIMLTVCDDDKDVTGVADEDTEGLQCTPGIFSDHAAPTLYLDSLLSMGSTADSTTWDVEDEDATSNHYRSLKLWGTRSNIRHALAQLRRDNAPSIAVTVHHSEVEVLGGNDALTQLPPLFPELPLSSLTIEDE